MDDDLLQALNLLSVTVLRLYDVQMSLLAATNPDAARMLEEVHAQGRFIGVAPTIGEEPFEE